MAVNRFPPANWLRTFELVARYMSFSKAAQHLNISTSAVSQQIRNLEDYLDCKLFLRTGNTLLLTEAARGCIPSMHHAFSQLQRAVDQIRVLEGRESLSISVAPSFATKWLIDHLGRFCTQHPNLDLRIFATATLETFNGNEIDIAIRHGQGHYPGLVTRKLMSETIVAVAAPKLLAEIGGFDSPEDLKKLRLLHDVSPEVDHTCPDWEMIANIYGVDDLQFSSGLKFNSSGLIVDAARAGLGAGLVRSCLARDSIKNGELAMIFERSFEIKQNYYVVYRQEMEDNKKIRAFVKWIEGELQAT